MATPAQLMQTLHETTGIPIATIVELDRRLVKANLRFKAGRGFNAAEMTPLDAARLLTAVLTAPRANEAAEAVARYSVATPDEGRSSAGLFAGAGFKDLVPLSPQHSFVDALAAMFKSGVGGGNRQAAGRARQRRRVAH